MFGKTGGMVEPRWYHTATLLSDGRVLFVGGQAGAGWANSSAATSADEPTPSAQPSAMKGPLLAEIYDPATGRFYAAGNPAADHTSGTATKLRDGRVLVAGGWNTSGVNEAVATAELWQP